MWATSHRIIFCEGERSSAPRAYHVRRKFGQVTWTREDDIQHDYYHAICAQHLEAALDQDGRANAWLHRTVSPAIEATFQPDIVYGSGDELGQGVVDMPYDIPNVRCENGAVANHVRIGW